MAGRLPVIELRWKGNKPPWRWGRWTRWFYDERLAEFRKVNNPHDRISQDVILFAKVCGQLQGRKVEGEKGS